MPSETTKVTRFEVIDHRTGVENGRAFVSYYCRVESSLQDDGRTLKVFIGDRTHDGDGEPAPSASEAPSAPLPEPMTDDERAELTRLRKWYDEWVSMLLRYGRGAALSASPERKPEG